MRTLRGQRGSNVYAISLDWWLAFAVMLVILFLLYTMPTIALAGLPWWLVVPAVLIILWVILTMIDSCFFTYYQLTEHELLVTSQLRRYRFPYAEMGAVKPEGLRGLLSTWRYKRFALSAHSYSIRLRKCDWKAISVSPRRRDVFLDDLHRQIAAHRRG